jgi:hypothetical protein
MRFNGKHYGDDARKAAVDFLWSQNNMPVSVFVEGRNVPARAFFDTATPGVGWIIDTRCGEGDTSLASDYALKDRAALQMMRRMVSVRKCDDASDDSARLSALLKIDALAYWERDLVTFPESQADIRKLGARYRAAARAFWKYALTRS